MPKGQKVTHMGATKMDITCKCGKTFSGHQGSVKKLMIIHNKVNHPENLQEVSQRLISEHYKPQKIKSNYSKPSIEDAFFTGVSVNATFEGVPITHQTLLKKYLELKNKYYEV